MKLKRFATCVIVTALFGCQLWSNNTGSKGLIGMWETSAPAYANCELEIKDELIIFRNRASYANVNYINKIKRYREAEKTLYTIHYEDKKGGKYKLSLFYCDARTGDVIRFKNQQGIKWTRKKIVPRS